MGFKTIGEVPSEDSSVQDLLLYALTPFGGHKPQWGMVLTVAAELEMLSRCAEGSLQVFLGSLSRRLHAAVDLDKRIESEHQAGAKP